MPIDLCEEETEEVISEKRIVRGGQATDKDELQPGRIYQVIRVRKSGLEEGAQLEVLALESDNPDCIRVRYLGNNHEADLWLAEYGIVPYHNGKWNIARYLVPAKKSDFSAYMGIFVDMKRTGHGVGYSNVVYG